MKRHFAAALTLLATLILPASLSAKGPTLKIIIKGASLTTPIEITDTESLKNFEVWAGAGVLINDVPQTEGFIIDWSKGVVAERPNGLQHYEVSFYAGSLFPANSGEGIAACGVAGDCLPPSCNFDMICANGYRRGTGSGSCRARLNGGAGIAWR